MLPAKVVIENNSLGQIKREQMVFLGNPEYGCNLQPTDFATFARACGATGFTIRGPSRLSADPREGARDPFEPPMPPKIPCDRATRFAQSLVKGQPHRGKIALTVLSDKVRELI